MSDLTVFDFKNNQLRVVMIDGDPWFVLTDTLAGMGSATRTSDAKSVLEKELGDDVVSNYTVSDELGRKQDVLIISESALTFMVSRSRTEKGKELNRWVHKEVLPNIRKTGTYGIDKLSRLEILTMALDSEKKYLAAEAKSKKLEGENLLLAGAKVKLEQHNNKLQGDVEHLVEVVDHQEPYARLGAGLVNIDENSMTVAEFAKAHTKMGSTNLYRELRSIGFIMAGSCQPYQKHVDAGRAKIIRVKRENQPWVYDKTTILTPKGQKYVLQKLYELEKAKVAEQQHCGLDESDF